MTNVTKGTGHFVTNVVLGTGLQPNITIMLQKYYIFVTLLLFENIYHII